MKSFFEWINEEFRFQGKTLGILSAHTEIDSAKEKSINKKRSLDLFSDLRSQGYDPWPFWGEYNDKKEKAFVISDITKSDLIKLGDRYNQNAVIWAKKIENDGYSVEWIEDGIVRDKMSMRDIRQLMNLAKSNPEQPKLKRL